MRRARPRARWLGVLLVAVASASLARAQHAPVDGAAPPPPSGDGELVVRVAHPSRPEATAGLDLALYSLSPDGSPGYAGGRTDDTGQFTFRGLSREPGIVYLVGAQYGDIPFGERVVFEADATTARVEIAVSDPITETSAVDVEELRVRIDWMGDQLLVREIVRLSNPSGSVIRVPAGAANEAIFDRPLEAGARDFAAAGASIGDGLALEDGHVRFRGPLYPGEQSVEYRYAIPLEAGERASELPLVLDRAAARVVVIAGTPGVELGGRGLVESSDVQSDAGTALHAWARPGLGANERLALAVRLPEARLDPSLVSIPRSDVWLELDDTRMTATVDLQLAVEPGAPVAGRPDAPLLRVAIPDGARMQGVAPEAEALGLVPRADGGFDVIGPIGPGTTSLGFAYDLPTGPRGVELALRFPLAVQTLNVLVADTGLALSSERLHRRRPFRSGTRNYLHREAFNVAADETVDLSLEPLRATGLSERTSLAFTIVAAAVGAWFLFAPLRSATRREAARETSPLARIRSEREAVYTAIRDLDHDFETAKLEESDYHTMRDDLRTQAIELLRREREAGSMAASPGASAAIDDGATAGDDATASRADRDLPRPRPAAPASAVGREDAARPDRTTGGFCPHCGEGVRSTWRFCSHCGGPLDPPAEASG